MIRVGKYSINHAYGQFLQCFSLSFFSSFSRFSQFYLLGWHYIFSGRRYFLLLGFLSTDSLFLRLGSFSSQLGILRLLRSLLSRSATLRMFFLALAVILVIDFSRFGETWADWYCLCDFLSLIVVWIDGLEYLERLPCREQLLLLPRLLRKRRFEDRRYLGLSRFQSTRQRISVLYRSTPYFLLSFSSILTSALELPSASEPLNSLRNSHSSSCYALHRLFWSYSNKRSNTSLISSFSRSSQKYSISFLSTLKQVKISVDLGALKDYIYYGVGFPLNSSNLVIWSMVFYPGSKVLLLQSSKIKQPRLHISLLAEQHLLPISTSGALYHLVAMNSVMMGLMKNSDLRVRESPKSQTLTSQLELMRMLEGLRSRCTTPAL